MSIWRSVNSCRRAPAGWRLRRCRQSGHRPHKLRVRYRRPGPAPDTTWQAQNHPEFALASFAIDWQAQTVTCPQGQRSQVWSPSQDAVLITTSSTSASVRNGSCGLPGAQPMYTRRYPARAPSSCVRKSRMRPGAWPVNVKLPPFSRPPTPKARAGIEGTISQATDAYGLRQARYIGLAKTHLQNIFTALAINVARAMAWLAGKPHAKTRRSRFAALRSFFEHPTLPSPAQAAT